MNLQLAGYEPNADMLWTVEKAEHHFWHRHRRMPQVRAGLSQLCRSALVSLRQGDEELVAERQVYEQTEELEAATLVENLRSEYQQSRAQLQQELSLQIQEHIAHFEQVEVSRFAARLHTVETALATEFTAQRAQLLGHFHRECEEITQQLVHAETRSRDAF